MWLKPHLAPLYSWRAALSDSTVARLSDVVIMTLEYLSLTFKDMSFKVSASRPVRKGGVAFRTDAKCTDGLVVLGGWECCGPAARARWFSIKVGPDVAPFLFDKEGKSQWASASAELLATIAALYTFGHLEPQGMRRSMTVELRAETDNQSNERLARKGSTTKWPLLTINMQLSHLLMKASLQLNLAWRPRDENKEADALTNSDFKDFDLSRRIACRYEDLPLHMLNALMDARDNQLAEREAKVFRDKATGSPRFGKKRKKGDKTPWG